MNTQPKKYPRTILARVSETQREQIQADADAYGKSVSAYVRDRLTGKRIEARTDQQMLNELRRIGGLIKHVKAPREIEEALHRLAERIG